MINQSNQIYNPIYQRTGNELVEIHAEICREDNILCLNYSIFRPQPDGVISDIHLFKEGLTGERVMHWVGLNYYVCFLSGPYGVRCCQDNVWRTLNAHLETITLVCMSGQLTRVKLDQSRGEIMSVCIYRYKYSKFWHSQTFCIRPTEATAVGLPDCFSVWAWCQLFADACLFKEDQIFRRKVLNIGTIYNDIQLGARYFTNGIHK